MTPPKMFRILLVEDNPGDVRLVREMLAEVNPGSFDITHVSCLSDVSRTMGNQEFDVALVDLSLPDASGLCTVTHLHTVNANLPVVVLSSLTDEDTALLALQNGAQDYLVKGRGDAHTLVRALRYAVERKQSEDKLTYLAQYDHLTGLPNRALFRDRLNRAMTQVTRYQGTIGLMFLDLDHFKEINDTLGHDVGDLLLKAMAARLKKCVREGDTLARLGGDEFTVILDNLGGADDATAVAEKIIAAMQPPFELGEHEIFVTSSVGIALYPNGGKTAEDLIKHADAAMYHAKSLGRNNYQFYTTTLDSQGLQRMTLENRLRHALEREEFLVYYQPLIDPHSKRITGAEALLRWQPAGEEPILPGEFIYLLEQTGLIIAVGEWVLQTACTRNRAWQNDGLAPIPIAVNLSARQFRQKELAATVERALLATGLESRYLQLELTEGLLMENTGLTDRTLTTLKEMGVRLSVDDFGTGYSSLSYLKRFPLDTLKIDQSFVHDLATGPHDPALVNAIIALGHSLRLTVVAEGVETAEQLAFLSKRGCDEVQGYYFSYPLPTAEFTALLAGRQPSAP
ncbi:MAG: PAS/PAC and GAF sensor-containing diguanylate cyclase/phosphodiesterase [Gammaproteobacteria bacterium]|nr:MAG: PAS/PAC and GAF sensor-containing diguanylate cyclase/phosphodiesterase [Gammaproteobacteria bacterium]TND05014.1 MAG: PAS/PAC and GAF sensor-containing diguanylate cyclase/phosphodiesterase [Gammaproteobacteria bacterium]